MSISYDETLAHLVHIIENLSDDMAPEARYQCLLEHLAHLFPCDAASLMQLEGQVLRPVAIVGLSPDTLGRRFPVSEHPRLQRIIDSDTPVQFPHDSELPDPFDGLVTGHQGSLKVHDCVGTRLMLDNAPWGLLTLDALEAGSMKSMSPNAFRSAIAMSNATVRMVSLINRLEVRVEQEQAVSQSLIADQVVEMIGQSAAMQTLHEEVKVVAGSDLSVLVLGETGTGKELVAGAIHKQSHRRHAPMIHVNCAALPGNIIESELFGHTRGAFTGAVKDRKGKFEIANHGTLFLDEVGELPLSEQVKLLRVLQNGEIQRVGSDQQIKVDVRIIAATNRDLAVEVKEGKFRADLYHRLSVYPIHVPPLRERDQDVLLLSGYFLELNRARLGLDCLRLSETCNALLQAYPWPGNVRELEHAVSRAALKARSADRMGYGKDGDGFVTVQPEDFDIQMHSFQGEGDVLGILSTESAPVVLLEGDAPLKVLLDNYQRKLIQHLLMQHGGNWAAIARTLQVDRANLHRLARRLGLKRR